MKERRSSRVSLWWTLFIYIT